MRRGTRLITLIVLSLAALLITEFNTFAPFAMPLGVRAIVLLIAALVFYFVLEGWINRRVEEQAPPDPTPPEPPDDD